MNDQRFLGLIEQSIKAHWDLPALSDYQGTTYTYRDLAQQIAEFHLILQAAQIRPGDKVAIVGRNSSRWAIVFFGALSYGAVVVPVLHEFKADTIHHIINHSEAKAVMVASANWKSMDEEQMPQVGLFIQLDDFSILKADEAVRAVYQNRASLFARSYPDFSPENISYYQEKPDELAVLNYTSGTTSSSKGVMIPFRSLWSNTQFAADNLEFIHPGDPILCMLPMAHMYGLAFEVLNSINKGCHIHFLTRVPSPAIIRQALAEIKPRLILAVPLIIEKIIKGNVFPVLEKAPMKYLISIPGVKLIIREKIRKKIETFFGGAFEEIVIGGAAINRDIEKFLRDIKFRYTVGYGMTECGPLVSYAQWDCFKAGSVGRIVDRMEVRIDRENPETHVGEILVRGMNTMLGYYKNEEATQAVMLPDGWMRTGDLGLLDDDGFLYIRGRCKTMILGPNGQNIYPEEIEDVLNNEAHVLESLVVTENEKLIALIYPDKASLEQASISGDEKIREFMQTTIDQVNRKIPRYCKISGFRIQEEEFEKTPKKSIKRYLYQR